jgi:hypothetical protein
MSPISPASGIRMRTGLWNGTPGSEGARSTVGRSGRIRRMFACSWAKFIEKKFEIDELASQYHDIHIDLLQRTVTT